MASAVEVSQLVSTLPQSARQGTREQSSDHGEAEPIEFLQVHGGRRHKRHERRGPPIL